MLDIVLLSTFMFASPDIGTDVPICSEHQQLLARTKIETKVFNLDLTFKEIEKVIADLNEVCKFEVPDMVDGISYQLYTTKDLRHNYVKVHNAFDGSFQLYGPNKS